MPEQPRVGAPAARKGRWAKRLATLFVVGMVLAALYAVDPRLCMKAISYGSIGMLIFSAWMMIKTYNKEKRVSRLALLVSNVAAIICGTMNIEGAQIEPPRDQLSTVFITGLVIGFVWSLTNRMSVREGRVMTRGNLFYLAIWMGVLAFNQLYIARGQPPPEVSMLAVMGSMGLVIANNLTLIVRSIFVQLLSRVEPATSG